MSVERLFSKSNSMLLKLGGIGFLLGLASWCAWAIMAAMSFLLLFPRDSLQMSGIYLVGFYPNLIFYGLLSISLLFSTIAGFALFGTYRSAMGLASGSAFALAFAITIVNLLLLLRIVPQYVALNQASPLVYLTFYGFPLMFMLTLILWGATLLVTSRKIGSPVKAQTAGVLFIISGAFGMPFLPVVFYWGFEIWLLMLGAIYAAGALLTALVFLRLSRISQSLH